MLDQCKDYFKSSLSACEVHNQCKYVSFFNSEAFFILWIIPLDSRIWIRPSAFLFPQRSVRPSLGLLSLLTGFSGHLLNSCVALQADSCAIPEFGSKDTTLNEKCGRSWSGNGSRKAAALSFCHCLHPAWLWLISSCSRFCLIQEGFCLTNARYYVRLWLQPAKGHSVWLKSFAKNCTWEHAVPSGCYENSSSTKCRTLPKKNLPTTG